MFLSGLLHFLISRQELRKVYLKEGYETIQWTQDRFLMILFSVGILEMDRIRNFFSSSGDQDQYADRDYARQGVRPYQAPRGLSAPGSRSQFFGVGRRDFPQSYGGAYSLYGGAGKKGRSGRKKSRKSRRKSRGRKTKRRA